MLYNENYSKWLNSETVDADTKNELKAIVDEKEIEDRFYKDLEFGTGGLRGKLGAGTNRMNIYTVGKTTQGLTTYLLNLYKDNISVCIGFDSRNMSKEFADEVAKVLCANGIKAYLYESLRPTPVISYTVRELKCNAGVVITASHNPKIYNGYKVYGNDGGQVTDNAADEILKNIEELDDFSKIRKITLENAKTKNLLIMIGENVDKTYIEKVKALTIRKKLVKESAKELKIIYTPIHGTGNVPVRRVLSELGYANVSVVKQQELPDGNFPTVNYPNPEDPAVFKLALEMAEDIQPDIIFGTDPDCDRIGVVVKNSIGEYKVLTGNQTGVLLTHYILKSLRDENKLPINGAVIKTIVTSEMAKKIADDFHIELIDVLTGFKYIGEKIKEFEQNKNHTYLFGFEESYGYLAGTFVRDKDAVIAATLICEMTLYYKSIGMSLYDALIKLYEKYGFYKESLISMDFVGKEGQEKIKSILNYLRSKVESNINGINIKNTMDYETSVEKDLLNKTEKTIDLPKSNVLKFILENGAWFVIRPSGTEPKMKIYVAEVGNDLDDADNKLEEFKKNVIALVNKAK